MHHNSDFTLGRYPAEARAAAASGLKNFFVAMATTFQPAGM
jgi:hypothetical protein